LALEEGAARVSKAPARTGMKNLSMTPMDNLNWNVGVGHQLQWRVEVGCSLFICYQPNFRPL
jgi:hypothetical protein